MNTKYFKLFQWFNYLFIYIYILDIYLLTHSIVLQYIYIYIYIYIYTSAELVVKFQKIVVADVYAVGHFNITVTTVQISSCQ